MAEIPAILTKPQPFLLYEHVGNAGLVVSKEVFAVCLSDGRNPPALCWHGRAGSPQDTDAGFFTLDSITDVYLGKRTLVFKMEAAEAIPSQLCFSVLDNQGTQLNLVARSKDLRDQWLGALEKMLRASETQIKVAGRKSPRAADGKEPAAGDAKDQALRFLSTPAPFAEYWLDQSGQLGRREVALWYESNEDKTPGGHLLWSVGGRQPESDAYVDVNSITDVFAGRRASPVFEHPDMAKIPSTRCFAIYTKQRQLHFVAATDEQRHMFLKSLMDIIKPTVPVQQQPGAFNRNASPQPNRGRSPGPMSPQQGGQGQGPEGQVDQGAALQMWEPLMRPRPFTQVWVGSRGRVESRQVEVYYRRPNGQGSLGTLCWNEGGLPPDPSDHIEMGLLTDIFAGKHTPAFKHSDSEQLPKACCFSLSAGGREQKVLNLVAQSDKERYEFLTLITHGLDRLKGVQKTTPSKPRKTASSPQQNGLGSPGPAGDQSPYKPQSQIQNSVAASPASYAPPAHGYNHASPRNGHTRFNEPAQPQNAPDLTIPTQSFTQWMLSPDGQLVSRQIIVSYDPPTPARPHGTLIWATPEGLRDHDWELDLAKVTDIYAGKRTYVFQQPGAVNLPGPRCFSMCSDGKVLNLQASTEDQRAAFFKALMAITNPEAVQPAPAAANQQQQAQPPQPMAAEPEKRNVWTSLMEPQMFTQYTIVPTDGSLACREIQVAYAPSTAEFPLGYLFWAPIGQQPHPDDVLDLSRVTDIWAGKQTQAFTHPLASDLPKGCCCAIATATQILNLRGAKEEQTKNFLHTLTQLIKQAKTVDITANQLPPQSQQSGLAPVAEAKQPAYPSQQPQMQMPPVSAAPEPQYARTTNQMNGSAALSPTPAGPTQTHTDEPAETGATNSTMTGVPPPLENRPFLQYWVREDGKLGSRAIVISYEHPNDGRPLGELKWHEVGMENMLGEELPLEDVTDVLAGKKSPVFLSPAAEALPKSRCLTIVCANIGKMLDLRAPSDQERDEFLEYLRNIFAAAATIEDY